MTLLASVIIPVRDEEARIEACLTAVAAQDAGADRLEVIVADGRSTDGTREVLARVGPAFGFARFEVVENRAGGISAGLNRALRAVTAPITVRVDARSRIDSHYIRTVVDVLSARTEVGVVGGAQIAVEGGDGVVSAAIARALSNRYATGFSRYRRATESGPSDTVWMGAFRTDELRDVGGWNESLVANEDYELCERFRSAGKTVWFEADLRSSYVARDDLRAVANQYFGYGRVKGRRWATGARVAPRHAVLLAAPPAGAVASVWLARRLGLGTTLGLGLGGLLLVDHAGACSWPATAPVRLAAAATSVTIGGAWWAGVVVGCRAAATEGQRHPDVQVRPAGADAVPRPDAGCSQARPDTEHGAPDG